MNKYEDQPTISSRQSVENQRIYSRNISSRPLQPYLDARAVSTKYARLPVVDMRPPVRTELTQQATYDPHQVFNPGNAMAPWSGFAAKIDDESRLKCQNYATHDCPQSEFIPSSTSSLYSVKWSNSVQTPQPFQELFDAPTSQLKSSTTTFDTKNVGYAVFNNATRQQLKDA